MCKPANPAPIANPAGAAQPKTEGRRASQSNGTVAATRNSTLADTIVGGGSIAVFATVWVGSVISPVLFILALLYGWPIVTGAIALITAIAYAPFSIHSQTFLAAMRQAVQHAFEEHSVTFEEGALPPEPGTGAPRLYAVHPHGIFSLGWSTLFMHPQMSSVTFCFSPALYYRCLYTCRHTCLYRCLHTCLHACLHAWLHTCLYIHLHTRLHKHLHICLHA